MRTLREVWSAAIQEAKEVAAECLRTGQSTDAVAERLGVTDEPTVIAAGWMLEGGVQSDDELARVVSGESL